MWLDGKFGRATNKSVATVWRYRVDMEESLWEWGMFPMNEWTQLSRQMGPTFYWQGVPNNVVWWVHICSICLCVINTAMTCTTICPVILLVSSEPLLRTCGYLCFRFKGSFTDGVTGLALSFTFDKSLKYFDWKHEYKAWQYSGQWAI